MIFKISQGIFDVTKLINTINKTNNSSAHIIYTKELISITTNDIEIQDYLKDSSFGFVDVREENKSAQSRQKNQQPQQNKSLNTTY